MHARSSTIIIAATAVCVALTAFTGCQSAMAPSDSATPPLAIDIVLEPDPPQLPDDRRINVRAAVENVSRRFVNVLFASSQRIDLELRDLDNTRLYRWSDDRHIGPAATNLAVNPGEKAVFDLQFPTRGMIPGQPYRVEVFLPGHDRVRTDRIVIPQPSPR